MSFAVTKIKEINNETLNWIHLLGIHIGYIIFIFMTKSNVNKCNY